MMSAQGVGLEAPGYWRQGRLDMRALLGDFLAFWRENSEIWAERWAYKEAAPHLILQAFLQRVLNGGGRLDREFASSRGRVDLCVHYQGQRYPIEVKIYCNERSLEEGLGQLGGYLERLGCPEGWLVLFDPRPGRSWDERIYWREERVGERIVHLVGG
jgi:hypothetical protein